MELTRSLRRDVVRDLHPRPAVLASARQPVLATIRQMQSQQTGCVLICDGEGRLEGIFTERDVLQRVIGAGVDLGVPLAQVMSRSPATVRIDDPLAVAIDLLHSRGLRHLPVIDDAGAPTGVISVKRVMEYLVEHFPHEIYNLPDSSPALNTREGA